MNDLGILMTPANREAIVEGRKGMTRRQSGLEEINKAPDEWHLKVYANGVAVFQYRLTRTILEVKAPCAVGQRLYIREPYYRYGKWVKNGLTKKTERQAWKFEPVEPYIPVREKTDGFLYMDDAPPRVVQKLSYRGTGWYKRSPLFMPKKFARTWLLVTDVKAPERVHKISLADVLAEGVEQRKIDHLRQWFHSDDCPGIAFGTVLDSAYGKGTWQKNEWYWPIEFKKE